MDRGDQECKKGFKSLQEVFRFSSGRGCWFGSPPFYCSLHRASGEFTTCPGRRQGRTDHWFISIIELVLCEA